LVELNKPTAKAEPEVIALLPHLKKLADAETSKPFLLWLVAVDMAEMVLSTAATWAAKLEPMRDAECQKLRRKAGADAKKLQDALLDNNEATDEAFYKNYSQQAMENIRKLRVAAKDRCSISGQAQLSSDLDGFTHQEYFGGRDLATAGSGHPICMKACLVYGFGSWRPKLANLPWCPTATYPISTRHFRLSRA
jgi:hypothetical protein